MTDLLEIVGDSRALLGLDAAFASVSGDHRGWILVDGRSADLLAVRVHVRPWLDDPPWPPRIRPETVEHRFQPVRSTPGYGVAWLGKPDGKMSEAGYQGLSVTLDDGRPHLLVCREKSGERLRIRRDGGPWELLPEARINPPASRLSLRLVGHGPTQRQTTLPHRFNVSAESARAVVEVRVVETAGFEKATRRFELQAQDGPLESGHLLLEVDLRTDGDRLQVTADGFPRPVVVTLAGRPRSTRRFRGNAALWLHLLFDRTTLDLESWPEAMAMAVGLPRKSSESEVYSQAEEGRRKGSWNSSIRHGLAAALEDQLERLHKRVRLDLWWFADQPQQGIEPEPPEGLPMALQEWGHAGGCEMERLDEALSGVGFDYASGLDLFDSVDTLLSRVRDAILAERRRQHAVLIVGDSPPPPAGPEDPLSRYLVDSSPRCSARSSEHFVDSLQALTRAGVPVGWMFVRHARDPSARSLDLLRYYPGFQTLRQKTLVALRQIPDLLVESAEGVEEFPRALAALFGRMRFSSRTPGLRVEDPP